MLFDKFMCVCVFVLIYKIYVYYVSVCKESLEVLTLCLFLKPDYLSQLIVKKDWQTFLIDLILLANNRYIT